MANSRLLSSIADEQGLSHHKGVAQICEAIVIGDLVDCIGDVVYSEASNVDFAMPSLDSGEDVYASLLALLDEAIVNLSTEPSSILQDAIYGDASKWIKLANSIKLKMYIQSRLVQDNSSSINSIIQSGNYITSSEDDFQIDFSTSIAPTDSRSFLFQNNYLSGAENYQSNYFMAKLKDRFSAPDPRLNYYIYRQTLEEPTGIFLTCEDQGFDFCYIGEGYWGRDHGDNNGVPPDGFARSTYGVYPAGGAFDVGAGVDVSVSGNLGGAGIQPLLLASQLDFLLAESALMSNTTGDPLEYLKAGITKSMNKVFSFAPGNHDQSDIDTYIASVEGVYNSVTTDEDKLNVIVTELMLASYGSAFLVYNTYRRTGLPSDLQDPVVELGPFPRSFFLPNVEVNANENISQKLVTDKVFWDTNPDGFIN